MYEFRLPTKIIFGRGSIFSLGNEAKKLGNKALLVTGQKSLRTNKTFELVEKICRGKLELIFFEGVAPEPDAEIVDKGRVLACQKKCDLVIGLGGGAVLDTAKAIAGLMNEKNDHFLTDYLEAEDTKVLDVEGVPFIALPTTAGSGSEVTGSAIVLNNKSKKKINICYPHFFSKLAIIDPNLTSSCPKSITAFSGMDTLTHLVEGYLAEKSSILTNRLALDGMKLVRDSLVNAYRDGDDLISRESMCQASLLGGILIVNSDLGMVHGLSSILGPLYSIPHGLVNAVLLPFVMEFNFSACTGKFKNMANALCNQGDEIYLNRDDKKAIEKIREINKELNIPKKLKDIGVKSEDFSYIITKSLVSSSVKKNPEKIDYDTLLNFLKAAY